MYPYHRSPLYIAHHNVITNLTDTSTAVIYNNCVVTHIAAFSAACLHEIGIYIYLNIP